MCRECRILLDMDGDMVMILKRFSADLNLNLNRFLKNTYKENLLMLEYIFEDIKERIVSWQ